METRSVMSLFKVDACDDCWHVVSDSVYGAIETFCNTSEYTGLDVEKVERIDLAFVDQDYVLVDICELQQETEGCAALGEEA